MPKTSWVWKYACVINDGFVKCNVCDTKLHYGGSTSTVHKHLKQKHKLSVSVKERFLPEDENEGERSDSSIHESFSPESANSNEEGVIIKRPRDSSSSSSQEATPHCPSKRQENITKALAKMIAMCQLKLSFSHSQGFINFMKEVDPGYKVPYPQAIKSRLGLAYNEVREKITKRLETVSSVSLTTDEWSSLAHEGYLSTTVHYIDYSWSLGTHTLNTVGMEERPTSDNIAIMLDMVQEDWNICTKVHSIVHDNANVMKAAVRLLNKDNINCAGHTLQLCIKDALQNIEEYNMIQSKAQKIVSHFKHSNIATTALINKQRQLGINEERLVQSCPTRWDSIYFMCDVLYRNTHTQTRQRLSIWRYPSMDG
ncbi:zinc finger BED domain-containing protein 1-like, partial [Rhagoletis pomonella]|uniref:zinc finger BED domain-containing protein 1-like n=1 Tax=Rhagoletis pomonella TaxID=28610 RepID=UPI001784BF69